MAKRKSKQLELIRKQGGARHGSGRKKKLPKDIRNHLPRENLTGKHPLHVNFKLQDGLSCLRHKYVFQVFRIAIACARERGYRVNHFSILRNHGHLIVEVENKKQLESLMKIITIRIALKIKKLTLEVGRVFRDRYFLHVLKTPTEVRRALAYVLLNEQKHFHGSLSRMCHVRCTAFSSAPFFKNWTELLGRRVHVTSSDYRVDSRTGMIPNTLVALSPPRTWLLLWGWKRALSLA